MPWDSCLDNGVATIQCVPIVFKLVINAALMFSGVTALVFIILSGIKFITSGGDPKQVEGARKTMTWAIIGLVVILLSFFIINIIGSITGAHCIRQIGLGQCL